MHSLFNILYTLCLHKWSCRDHRTWKLIISYSKVFKSFSHSWKFASDATSGSFEPKSESTTSTKQKVSLANKNRPGGDLEKIYWMEMSMCLQIYLSFLTLRQRRGSRSICSWERRMSTGLGGAAAGAVLAAPVKALLKLLGFSWCYSSCKAALFFSPFFFSFCPLLKNSSENQFCWAVSADHTWLPSTPRSRSCAAAAGWPPALLQMANTAARLLYFHLQHKNKSIVDLLSQTWKRTFLSVWICLDQMKRKAIDEKEK